MKYFYFGGEPPKMKGNRFNLPINRLFSWAFIAALCLIGQIGFAQQTITHSSSQTLLSFHGVACTTGPNSFMRVFDLSNDFGITDDFAVSEAQFGVESLDVPSVDVTVNIYSTAGTFPAGFPGNATLQAVATTTLTFADEMQVVSVPINGVIPFGEKLILEVTTPQVFFPGANDAGETDLSYIMGSACGITTPSTFASVNPDFSDVHLVMNVIGDYLTACTGIPNGGTASTSLANGGTGTSYNVFVSGHTVADDMSYQWEADFGSGWQDQGTASSTYAPYNATAQMPLGSTEQWRLKSTCTASGETSYSTIATFDVTYCIPVIDYDVEPITRVIFSDIDHSSSSSSTDAYEDFTAIEGNVSQGVSYMFTGEGYTGGSFTNFFTVWIDWNQNGTFESSEMYEIGSIYYSSGTDGVQATSSIYVPVGIPTGATTMRVIKNYFSSPTDPCGLYDYGQAEDYTILVGPPPSCLPVSDIATTSATFQTSTITWTANNSETSWNISWGNPGYTPGDGDELGTDVSTSTTYQITGLTEDTHYDVYVQADCGGGDESMWVGPYTIFTGYCVPTSDGNTTRYIDGVVTQGAILNLNNTGTGLSPDAYGDYTDTDTLRVYPGQEISIELTHPSSTYHYRIWVDWDNDLDFDGPNDLIYSTTSYENSPHTVDLTVPLWAAEGAYRIRVRNFWTTSTGGACGNYSSSEAEDYTLHIVSPPSCLPVSDIATTSATFQTSTITWTANNSETSWNISWGNPGYTPGDGDELGTDVSTSTTYQITGLTEDTHYDVYVQADCGGGDESMWAGPYTIFTGYCEVSTTNTLDYLSSVVSEDALTDISYSATTQPAGSYANETAQLFRAFPGQTFDMKTSYVGGSNGVNIWIDWDQDLDFDPVTELVASQASSSSDKTFSIVVPTGTAPGTYRVRVRGQFGASANPPACGSVSYGSTIDFNLVVIECTTTPGIDGYAEVCRAEGTIELNDVVTLSSTEGTWEFDMNPTLLNGSELNVSSLPAGSYDVLYVVDFPGCIEDTTVATIDVFGPSSAGTGGIISVCAGAPINLYSALSGNVDMGGDWYDYNGNLLGTSQPTAPSLGASYNYTYITSNGVCDADTAFVEVIVDASPNCTSNIQEEMAVNLSVYPNPTTDVLHIVNPTNIAALKVEVLDMNGRIVLVENSALKNTTEATISLGNLNTGVYTLRVYNEEGQKIFKVVKR